MSLFGLLESDCEERVIKNASTWVTIGGGQIVPSLTIQRHLCPNLCSGHGNCNNGVCYCHKGKQQFQPLLVHLSPQTILDFSFHFTSFSHGRSI